MKIINFKINKRILTAIVIIIFLAISLFALTKFLDYASSERIIMNNENYTNILKECHENMDKYINKEIYTIGYIFRPADVKKDQFVIARDMLINQTEAQIVGFLAQYEKSEEFEDNIWVEVRGKIKKGNYHGEIPIIEIKSIKKITTPEDIFVYPPVTPSC